MKMVLVNAITLSRMVLSGIIAYYILQPDGRLAVITLLFTAVCATDLLDGFLARKLSVCSRTGAVLDAAADFIFVLSSVIALIAVCTFPAWMAAVIVLKFAEFCCTSFQIRRIGGCGKRVFLFDPLGKAAGISFFLLPYLFILLQYCLPFAVSIQIFTAICLIVTLAAFVSSVRRVRFLYRARLAV